MLGYTVALGLPELRAGVAAHYGHTYGLAVTADDVVMTTGSSGGFLLAFLAAFDAGDRVAMARPGYPATATSSPRWAARSSSCRAAARPGTSRPSRCSRSSTSRVDGLIVASPANPTGTVLPPDELAALATYCEGRGIQLISDEIYHGISYAGAPATSCAWSTSREAIVVNSFSKYFSMTGWRLGWLVVPAAPAPRGRPADRQLHDLPARARPARRASPRSRRRATPRPTGTSPATPPTGRCSSTGWPGWASTGSPPPTAPSTSTPTSPTSPTTRWRGPTGCWPRPGVALAPGIDFDPVDGHRCVRFSFAGRRRRRQRCAGPLGGTGWPDSCPVDQRRSEARPRSAGGMTLRDGGRAADRRLGRQGRLAADRADPVFLAGYAWQVLDTVARPGGARGP